MPTKPRAPVPPPPFAAFRTAVTAQRRPAGPEARPAIPPPQIQSPRLAPSAAMAPPHPGVPRPWPGTRTSSAGSPLSAAGAVQRRQAAFGPSSMPPIAPPARPAFLPVAVAQRQPARLAPPACPSPFRVVQRATAASAPDPITRYQYNKDRIQEALKLIYQALYKNGIRIDLVNTGNKIGVNAKNGVKYEDLYGCIYGYLTLEAKSPYFSEKLGSLGSLLVRGDPNYSVKKQRKKEDLGAASDEKVNKSDDKQPEVAISNKDLEKNHYYHIHNKHYRRRDRIGIARRIVINLKSQQDGMRLAEMFITLFRSAAPPATAAAGTDTAAAGTSAAAAAGAGMGTAGTAASTTSAGAAAVTVAAGPATDFVRHIYEFKVFLGNKHSTSVKRDKLVVYYDYIVGPDGIDWVGNAIVAAVQGAGVSLERHLAAFYSIVAPGIAWAEEPKYYSADPVMAGSFSTTRAKVIFQIVKIYEEIEDFETFYRLVANCFAANWLDIDRAHRHR